MEARIRDNQIILPIGTTVSFEMIGQNQQKIDLSFTESEEPLKFFALFDKNDVDFEIEINNSKCIHGIGYTLIVNNGFYDYYIGAGEVWSMEALYTRGRKLHFISENSEKGQNVIKQTAEEFDITYSESANICSKIEFNFEVEKVVPKKPERLRDQNIGSGLSFGSPSASNLMSGGNGVIDSVAKPQIDLSSQSRAAFFAGRKLRSFLLGRRWPLLRGKYKNCFIQPFHWLMSHPIDE